LKQKELKLQELKRSESLPRKKLQESLPRKKLQGLKLQELKTSA
jgi:hypothetical protein